MRLRYVFLIFLMQGLLFTGFLYFKFSTSKASPLMHMVSLSILLTILISLFQLCFGKSTRPQVKRVAFSLIFSAVNFLILIFYVLTIYGYFHWSAAFTLDLFHAYIDQLPKLLSIVGISIFNVLFLILLCYLSIFLLYLYFSKFISVANKNIKYARFFKLKLFTLKISLEPISYIRLAAIFCIFLYALTYKLWLPREPFAIAITNNWSLSNIGPSELFTNFYVEKAEVYPYVGDSNIKPRPLILITIDALRMDQMGVYGGNVDNTPFLSSLLKTKQLQIFDDTYSICTVSFCGLLGILRSNYWTGLKLPSPTISDILKANNFETIFLLGGDHTNFANLRKFYGNKIDIYKDGSVDSDSYPNDDFEVLKWLKEIEPKDPQSTFMFIHLMSVHESGLRHDEFKRWQPSVVPISLFPYSTPTKEYETAYRNNYNNGILQADEMVRIIFKELKNKGILDNALVIISADHGEYLGEFNRFGHGREPYEPVSRIPLLV